MTYTYKEELEEQLELVRKNLHGAILMDAPAGIKQAMADDIERREKELEKL